MTATTSKEYRIWDAVWTNRNATQRTLNFALTGGLIAGLATASTTPLGILALSTPFVYSWNSQRKGIAKVIACIGMVPLSMLPIAFSGFIGQSLTGRVEQTAQAPITSGQSTNKAAASNVETSEVAATEEPPSSVTAGDFTISNVSIKPYQGDTSKADIAGKLWAVYADVTNNSNETKVPGYNLSAEVKDSAGRTFKTADFTVTSNAIVDEAFGNQAKQLRFTDGILPGSTRKNVQVGVFDTSPDASGLQLCVGGLFSGTSCIKG
jgi:hypothetical protein